MVKMKKHILYIALGLLALIAIITTVLAIGGVVTLLLLASPPSNSLPYRIPSPTAPPPRRWKP